MLVNGMRYFLKKVKKNKSVSMKSIQRNGKSIGVDIKVDTKDDTKIINGNII